MSFILKDLQEVLAHIFFQLATRMIGIQSSKLISLLLPAHSSSQHGTKKRGVPLKSILVLPPLYSKIGLYLFFPLSLLLKHKTLPLILPLLLICGTLSPVTESLGNPWLPGGIMKILYAWQCFLTLLSFWEPTVFTKTAKNEIILQSQDRLDIYKFILEKRFTF